VNPRVIRTWLMARPRPSMLRLTTGDGEPQDLRPNRSFLKTAETIEAMNPDLIEAVDKDNNLLRAMNLHEPETDSGGEHAKLPSGLEADPQALMLTHFADLVHRAYAHSTDVAFTKMVELVERMGDRSDAIEQRLERSEAAHRRLVTEQVDDAFDRAEQIAEQAGQDAGGGMVEQMAGAFMQGAMGTGPAPRGGPVKAKGKPNGKADG